MEHFQYNVYEILQPNDKPSEGFKVGRTFDDGVMIAKANLNEHPNAKGLTQEEIIDYINTNYPPKEDDLWN